MTHVPDIIPDIWPPCTSLLTHIAYQGGLDEIPNAIQDDSLCRSLASSGRSPSQFLRPRGPYDPQDRTRVPFMFVLYQTGMHGPQNGFRLIVAENGIAPRSAADALDAMGPIRRDTAEMVFLGADDLVEVVADVHDGHHTSREVTRRILSRIHSLGHCEWNLGVHHVAADGDPGCVARPIRESACYPLSTRKKGAAVSATSLTGRAMLLHVMPAGESRVCEGLILAKEGVSPEFIEQIWLGLEPDDSGGTSTVTIFQPDGRIIVYEGISGSPVETRCASTPLTHPSRKDEADVNS